MLNSAVNIQHIPTRPRPKRVATLPCERQKTKISEFLRPLTQ